MLVLDIDPTNRLTAYYDTYPYTLEDIVGDTADTLGVYAIRKNCDIGDIKSGDLTQDLDRLKRNTSHWQHESALGKCLAINNKFYRKVMLRGYSQGDWAEVFIYSDYDWVLEDNATSELERWFAGDVYTVHHERLETYTSNTDPSKTLTRWESIDSIGCCLLEDSDGLWDYTHNFDQLPDVAFTTKETN